MSRGYDLIDRAVDALAAATLVVGGFVHHPHHFAASFSRGAVAALLVIWRPGWRDDGSTGRELTAPIIGQGPGQNWWTPTITNPFRLCRWVRAVRFISG